MFFHASEEYRQEITRALDWAGAPDWVYKRMSLKEDTGFTYSNKEDGRSVVVICQGSCPCEEEDTFDHERFHLTMHIVSAYGIDPQSEEAAYLAGHIRKLVSCDCQECSR